MKRMCSILNRNKYDHKILSRFSTIQSNLDNISKETIERAKNKIKNGPGLKSFLVPDKSTDFISTTEELIPYLDNVSFSSRRKVYFEVYGCQMNVNDTEVVWSILKKQNYLKTDNVNDADIILIITCAIREGAETKIWHRLDHLRGIKNRRPKSLPHLKIGILGCMAERLKHKLIEKEQTVDIVAGPDSYKDLPRLLAVTENDQTAVNVLLSLDETYADVMPVRLNEHSKTAFVSIMRGCDNMCTYCIVPFTRGRERSRPIGSILDEVKQLSEQGIKEITILGQNVNSYRDLSECSDTSKETQMAKGFKTVYKIKKGGLRFADLLDKVSSVDPEIRIRFTSPHPKDFPSEVLEIIKERPNICNFLHLPAQSGSSAVLERMRRGYTREAYLELVDQIRSTLPKVSLSSDFICGFCHETDEEFEDTLSLMEAVKYNVAYLFPYSMREKTTAHRRYKDDIPADIKHKRHLQMVEVFRRNATKLNTAQIGETQLMLIEGYSKKSVEHLAGRNEGCIKIIIPNINIPTSLTGENPRSISPGDYVAVRVEWANSQILKGTPLFHTTLQEYHSLHPAFLTLENVSKMKAHIS